MPKVIMNTTKDVAKTTSLQYIDFNFEVGIINSNLTGIGISKL